MTASAVLEQVNPLPCPQAEPVIIDWDGQFVKESRVAPVYMLWRLRCQGEPGLVDAVSSGTPLAEDQQATLFSALSDALEYIKEKFGKRSLTWGEMHRVGRSGKYFPCDAASFGSGISQTRTLFTVITGELDKSSDEHGRA